MKLSELNLNDEYAIVPSWTYNSKSARDVATVKEGDVVKAKIFSLEKYTYEPSVKKFDSADFQKAPQGERSVGVIVQGIDNNNQTIYWTSRLADIIAVYSTLEPRWQADKIAQQQKEKEYAEKEQKERNHRAELQQRIEQARGSITNTTKELLGDKSKISISTNGYGLETHAVVEVSLDEYEKLIELAYAGKEAY